ncbi:unnamed protein product [Penicillium viridicatum]
MKFSSLSTSRFRAAIKTLGLADKWLAELLNILEETGVANKTLVVMVGDNFHVPLVFAHPQLPPIEINFPVASMKTLPTILDILSESGSLNNQAKSAIQDLLPIKRWKARLAVLSHKHRRTWLALRSAAKPYCLIIPVIPDLEGRFSNVETDPHELQALQDFDLSNLMNMVLPKYGEDAVQWIKDASHVAKWWVEENWRRYEYVP